MKKCPQCLISNSCDMEETESTCPFLFLATNDNCAIRNQFASAALSALLQNSYAEDIEYDEIADRSFSIADFMVMESLK